LVRALGPAIAVHVVVIHLALVVVVDSWKTRHCTQTDLPHLSQMCWTIIRALDHVVPNRYHTPLVAVDAMTSMLREMPTTTLVHLLLLLLHYDWQH
jgi:hypothetical protein